MTKLVKLSVVLGITIAGIAHAEEAAEPDAVAQANNPLANMKAFNMHNYYAGDLTGLDNASMNQLWFRYAQPIRIGKGDWLIRASLPVTTLKYDSALGSVSETGLGDFNIFAAYLFKMKNPALSFGVGPLSTMPTATKNSLGWEKWTLGFANVLFDGRKKEYQWGYLLTWQMDIAGDSNRDDVNLAGFQPFFMYQLGKGHYLRTAGIWAFNLDANAYTIPVGIGYGKVIKKDNMVYNMFVEPQVSVFDEGGGWPEWQIFIGLNLQFLGK